MKTMVTKVTERGQVSIPVSLREYMEIKPGMSLLWNKNKGKDRLITRNARVFRTLFPNLDIIVP